MKRHGNKWIEIRFNYSLIWSPTQHYKARFQWNNMEEIALWKRIDRSFGFYPKYAFGHPTYNWKTLHLGVITEISSAQGGKNSASSTQKNGHSWHKD
jgi:hypothetical protein